MLHYENESRLHIFPHNSTETRLFTIDSQVYITIGISVIIFFIIAVIENIIILNAFRRTPKLHTHTNYWIMSLIGCNSLIVLNAFPLLAGSCFVQDFILGDIGCIWDGFIVTLLGCTSIYLLTGLSVQRYRIMMREGYRLRPRKRQTLTYIGMCFVFGLAWAVMPLFGFGSYVSEGIGVSCAPDWRSTIMRHRVYTGLLFVSVLFIPLLVMVYCYFFILMKIWRAKQQNSSWLKERRVKRDSKVTFSVALTIVSFIVAWIPYAIVNLAGTFFDVDAYAVHPMLVQLPCLMAKTACVWNPIVYVCSNGDFRRAIRTYLRGLRGLSNSEISSDVCDIRTHAQSKTHVIVRILDSVK